jgi:hypothetical protein
MTGPEGPSGITQLNATNTYIRTANSVNVSTAEGPFLTTANPQCDPGDSSISGGFTVTSPLTSDAVTIQDIKQGNGWLITLKSTTNLFPFGSSVACFNNTP